MSTPTSDEPRDRTGDTHRPDHADNTPADTPPAAGRHAGDPGVVFIQNAKPAADPADADATRAEPQAVPTTTTEHARSRSVLIQPGALICLGLAVISAGLAVAMRTRAGLASPEDVSLMAAELAAAVVVGWFLAVAARAALKAPQAAAGVLFGVALFVPVGLNAYRAIETGKTARQAAGDATAMATIHAHAGEMFQVVRRQLETGAPGPDDAAALAQHVERIDDLAHDLKGHDRAVAEVLAAQLRAFRHAADEFMPHHTTLVRARPMEIAGVNSLAELDARVDTLADFRHANARFADAITRVLPECRAQLERRGVPHAEIEHAVSHFDEVFCADLHTGIRAADEAFANEAIKVLAFLRHHWGAWAVDPASGSLYFDERTDFTPYDHAVERLAAIVHEQGRLQQQITAALNAGAPQRFVGVE